MLIQTDTNTHLNRLPPTHHAVKRIPSGCLFWSGPNCPPRLLPPPLPLKAPEPLPAP